MSRKAPYIGVQIFGHTYVRYILALNDQEYWTGSGWTPHRKRALLYYHLELVQKDRRKLIAAQKRGDCP